jgi:hypothetical protein
MLLKGRHSHTSRYAQITSFRLVLYVTEELRSHASSNSRITSSRLVLYVTEGASLP